MSADTALGGADPSRDEGAAGRDTPRKRLLRWVAVQAAVVAAAVHLLWAWPRLGSPPDARPYLFVAGSALAVAVAVATLRAGEYRRLYALGAGTLGTFLGGFLAWHGTGAAAALAAEPLAVVAVIVEVVGFAAYLALFRLAPPTSVVVERREADGAEGEPEADGGTP
ncbi:hypothetical protein SAMN06266787_103247 [Halorubrum ezzemoulense]|uniref:DUF4345 domain-containing protein n=1 Tax=Halorubrum ezzemoulense TaxID=337243 RepID=A0A238X6Z0_HALEZ|nr:MULTISPECIES: hypothetical protein [Halorubrum]MDB9281227.1 hypothetical protein [Halorubrum ezzemoulense]MDB9284679.1 hypothetical protein [Halorubrum ezzemoulense]OTF08556.1 hypothetical protein B9G38_09180 [Halorubrum sp. SD612]TKX63153.1 hypothetical protein EXE47_14925 [Halorubrum sp. GN12_10-3_MGM]SNR54094.1 hypothetical protein SAMN06266787_103247 [Halorubrum ezzemoulense]